MTDKATQIFIEEHLNDDTRTLALQAARYPDVSMNHALTQIEGWQTAKEKLPTWAGTKGVLYPPRISMEQCSSEETALYKASLVKGERLTDLTGGFGIDCSYMSKNFSHATYIERNEELCRIARHNFHTLGLSIEVINGNCEEQLPIIPECDWIFADPARRNNSGGKVVALADCEPDISKLEEAILQKSKKAMIKCSPMLDLTAACRDIKNITDLHVIAVNNECKEVLLILSREKSYDTIALHCINIRKEGTQCFHCNTQSNVSIRYAEAIKEYLYEPNAAIQKAGCHAALTKAFDIEKLHTNSHLYTSKEPVKDFPGRIFIIERIYGFSKNEIKELKKEVKKANITIRNFPDTVQNIRKRLKIDEGGDIYIFATTLANGNKVLLKCKKA